MAGMTTLFNCPACGAPLEPPAGKSIMKCSYCKSSVIVPDALERGSTEGGTFTMSQVLQALSRGEKIEAIKILQTMTGASLADAREIVQAIEAGEAIDVTRFVDGEAQEGRSLGSLQADGRIPPEKPQVDWGSATDAEVQAYTRQRASRSRLSMLFVGVTVLLLVAGAAGFMIFSGGSSDQGTFSSIIASVPPILPTATPAYGAPVLSFGEEGTGPGMLKDPRAIGVDRNGNIYVADYSDGRIQIFDPQGKFLKLINVGKDVAVFNLAVAPDGSFYACYSGEIHHFDASGTETGQIPYPENADGYGWFESIAMGADGSLYAVGIHEVIFRFGPDGQLNLTIPDVFSAVTDHPELDMTLAVDGLGNIYVLGSFNYLVLKYSPEGRYLDQFGGETQHPAEGVEPGHFQAPDTLAVDGYGRIFVSDIWGVQVFDSSGQYLDFFPVTGAAFGMTFDLENNLYIASSTPRIIKMQIRKP